MFKIIADVCPEIKLNRHKRRTLYRIMKKYYLPEFFKSNPLFFLDNFKGKIWAVLNELIRYSSKYGNNVFVSRATLGERVGLCATQVGRITEKLCVLGFIYKEYFRYKIGNEFKSRCKYKINKFFTSCFAKRFLSYFFPALLSKSSMLPTTLDQCHSIYNNDIYISSLLLETKEQVSKKTRAPRIVFERSKNNGFHDGCVAGKERNKDQHKEILKQANDKSSTIAITQQKSVATNKPKRIPKIDDIPKDQMDKILKHDKHDQKVMINRRLQGIMLIWEYEDNEHSKKE